MALSREEFNLLVNKKDRTPEEETRLLPYKARRAVFLAAGKGERMHPVTLERPKPLVKVRGRRIIDGLLDAVLTAGIEEIYIVRGYKKEAFDELLETYPMLHFVDNDRFETDNNISSALLVKEYLQNAYILEADLCISNPEIIRPYHYTSDFLGIPMKHSDDWAFTVEDGVITDLFKGGDNCSQQVGISYWDREAGLALREDIPAVYEEEGGHDRFWEYVPILGRKDHYRIELSPCSLTDIVEIDSFEELKAIDPSYEQYESGGTER